MARSKRFDRDFVASVIAYDLREQGFSPEERERIADAFAAYLSPRGNTVEMFYRNTRTNSENEARDGQRSSW